jgi:hypothetical protein
VMFGVNPRTVNRWASDGRLGSVVTPGGRHRFRETEILALLVEWDRGGARVRAPRRRTPGVACGPRPDRRALPGCPSADHHRAMSSKLPVARVCSVLLVQLDRFIADFPLPPSDGGPTGKKGLPWSQGTNRTGSAVWPVTGSIYVSRIN